MRIFGPDRSSEWPEERRGRSDVIIFQPIGAWSLSHAPFVVSLSIHLQELNRLNSVVSPGILLLKWAISNLLHKKNVLYTPYIMISLIFSGVSTLTYFELRCPTSLPVRHGFSL